MEVPSPITFARGLSDSLQPNRLRALKGLNVWMDKYGVGYPFTSLEIDQLWRALQLTLWMADKRPVQQQVAAECVLFTRKVSCLVEWNRGFWYNIERIYETVDKFRVPKIHLLIRIYMSELFHQLRSRNWDLECISALMSGITSNVHKSVGAYIQLISVFVDELSLEIAPATFSDIPSKALAALLAPAFHTLEGGHPLSLITQTVDKLFTNPKILNSSARDLVRQKIKFAAISKKIEQDVREVLCACLDTIDATPVVEQTTTHMVVTPLVKAKNLVKKPIKKTVKRVVV